MKLPARDVEEHLVQVLPPLLQKIRQEASNVRHGRAETLQELLDALDAAWVAAHRLNLERAS